MATLYYAGDAQIAQTQTQISAPHFSIVHESKSESLPVSKSGNVIRPEGLKPEQSQALNH